MKVKTSSTQKLNHEQSSFNEPTDKELRSSASHGPGLRQHSDASKHSFWWQVFVQRKKATTNESSLVMFS
jgi:hypothetical protein